MSFLLILQRRESVHLPQDRPEPNQDFLKVICDVNQPLTLSTDGGTLPTSTTTPPQSGRKRQVSVSGTYLPRSPKSSGDYSSSVTKSPDKHTKVGILLLLHALVKHS